MCIIKHSFISILQIFCGFTDLRLNNNVSKIVILNDAFTARFWKLMIAKLIDLCTCDSLVTDVQVYWNFKISEINFFKFFTTKRVDDLIIIHTQFAPKLQHYDDQIKEKVKNEQSKTHRSDRKRRPNMYEERNNILIFHVIT